MPNDREMGDRDKTILRLRATVPTELIRPREQIKQPDGPWIAHPDLIDEERDWVNSAGSYAPDITMRGYRDLWNSLRAVRRERLRTIPREDRQIKSFIEILPSINMERIQGKTDHEVASAIERNYVGAHQYRPLSMFALTLIVNLTFMTCNTAT